MASVRASTRTAQSLQRRVTRLVRNAQRSAQRGPADIHSKLMGERALAPSGNNKRPQTRKKRMNTIQTKGKTHWLAHSKLSCVAALAFSAFQGLAQQVPSQPAKNI